MHNYDNTLERLLSLPHPVAMIGIHLCKQLSPSFCGLVNGLGSQKCLYACLAPCCLPRAVTTQKRNNDPSKLFTVFIPVEESVEDRRRRRDYLQRRKGGRCFFCSDDNHRMRDCPALKDLPDNIRAVKLQESRQHSETSAAPCWNCLQYGHYKANCPITIDTNRSKPPSQQPRAMNLDVTNVLKSPKPFLAYCQILAAQGFQNREVKVIETDLENKVKMHQEGNWNGERKSIYLITV